MLNWRKSTFSDQAGSDCVEVAFADTAVGVRDSKNTGPYLHLTVTAFRQLVVGVARLGG